MLDRSVLCQPVLCQNVSMSALLSPFMLRSASLRNRIVVPPLCRYSAASGEPAGRSTPGRLGLGDDGTEAALAQRDN
jgi:hypothetical protein